MTVRGRGRAALGRICPIPCQRGLQGLATLQDWSAPS